MNTNSKLCCFIADNENWKEILKTLGISVKEEYPIAIFNYDNRQLHDMINDYLKNRIKQLEEEFENL